MIVITIIIVNIILNKIIITIIITNLIIIIITEDLLSRGGARPCCEFSFNMRISN